MTCPAELETVDVSACISGLKGGQGFNVYRFYRFPETADIFKSAESKPKNCTCSQGALPVRFYWANLKSMSVSRCLTMEGFSQQVESACF